MILTSAQDFGTLIKTIRKQQGLTQSDLAAACGTGVRFIVDLEKGKPSCELDKALMVAAMLGIKIRGDGPLSLGEGAPS